MSLGKYIGGFGFFVSSFATGYFAQNYMNLQRENADIHNKPEMIQYKEYEDDLDFLAVCAQPLYESEDILSETDEIELYFLEKEFNRVSNERKNFRGDKKIAGLETKIKSNERKMKKDFREIILSSLCIFGFGGAAFVSTRRD